MKRIGIIGAGFSGTMTAVNLIRNAAVPLEIIIIDRKENFYRGIAYSPFSKILILNVVASRMSAFSDKPDHFLDWVMAQEEFKDEERKMIADAFLPRYLYGQYLEETWKNVLILENAKKSVIKEIDAWVVSLDQEEDSFTLTLSNDQKINVDICVLATGNNLPQNPDIENTEFFQSGFYFQNPWDIKSVKDLDPSRPVLLIGNGLTMVDTVMGLREQGFKNEICTLSRNGFHTLAHRQNGFKYTKLVDQLESADSFYKLVMLIRKHIKHLERLGFSAEPAIDSLRPYTQGIWQKMSEAERKFFVSKLRYFWDIARHRIPLTAKEKIQQLRFENKLHIISGKLTGLIEQNGTVHVSFYDKTLRINREIKVSRVINCTGPATDLRHVEKSLLKDCREKGIVAQDSLKLGINADIETLQVLNAAGHRNSNLFTIGPPLKGMLWETIAVNELRIQAEKLSAQILTRT